jgi:hypothetical protein
MTDFTDLSENSSETLDQSQKKLPTDDLQMPERFKQYS